MHEVMIRCNLSLSTIFGRLSASKASVARGFNGRPSVGGKLYMDWTLASRKGEHLGSAWFLRIPTWGDYRVRLCA
jgi:hypothetical protein